MDKQTLRQIMLKRRREISAWEQQRASKEICQKLLLELAKYPKGAVLSYLAYGREVDLSELNEVLCQEGRRLAVPKCEGLKPGEMVAVEYKPGCRLVKTDLGVMEPVGADVVPPGEIGVVLAPGVAFDRMGRRLGHGMGYYDRYLAAADVTVIGVCYAAQLVDEVPTDEFDRAVDLLIYD